MSALEDELASHLNAYKLSFEREYRYHKTRRWRFDFAFPDRKLGIEIEGGIWVGGRHTRASGFERDCEKYNAAVLEGWKVLRFTSRHIRSGEAIKTILEAIR